MSAAPSGEQFELDAAGQHVVAVELGGGLRAYSAGGRDVLEGYAVDEPPDGGRGQILAPWPNRLRDGRYEWDGETLQLELSEPAHRNAIHGLARGERWSLVERAAGHLTLGLALEPSAGYPFALDLEVRYALGVGGLTVEMTAENVGETPAPYGVGFHPYLAVGGGAVDDAELEIPAERMLVTDERAIPVSEVAVAGTEFDFRRSRMVGPLELDTCFTDLARGADGRARIVVRGVTLWLDGAFGYAMVYSGDTLAPGRRRRGLAIEPMTCPPNAFATHEHVVSLAPGARHVGVWGIEP
ncbi:MAG: aldose 1-epimerase family protein [Solirubrobacteraceae bacterium]